MPSGEFRWLPCPPGCHGPDLGSQNGSKMVHFWGPGSGFERESFRIWGFGPPKWSILDPFLGGLNPWPPGSPVAQDGAARQGVWGLDGPLRVRWRTRVRRRCPRCECIALWVSKWSKFGPFSGSGPQIWTSGSRDDQFDHLDIMDLGGPTPQIGPFWGPSGGPSQREGNALSLIWSSNWPGNGPFGPFGPFGRMGPKMGIFTPFLTILAIWVKI